jgi:YfiH family protein
MPIVESDGAGRRFAFATCPLGDGDLACVTTRDVAADGAARRPEPRFLEALGVQASDLATISQVHGERILACTTAGPQGRGDALVTDRSGVLLSIQTADCLPIFIVDPSGPGLALAHVGWRGARFGLAGKVVRALETLYRSRVKGLWVGVGPGIGPCCYEIGEDVTSAFDPAHVRRDGTRTYLDLEGAVTGDLAAAGVDAARLESSGHCTACEPELFHSHRRDASGERLFSLLGRGVSRTSR